MDQEITGCDRPAPGVALVDCTEPFRSSKVQGAQIVPPVLDVELHVQKLNWFIHTVLSRMTFLSGLCVLFARSFFEHVAFQRVNWQRHARPGIDTVVSSFHCLRVSRKNLLCVNCFFQSCVFGNVTKICLVWFSTAVYLQRQQSSLNARHSHLPPLFSVSHFFSLPFLQKIGLTLRWKTKTLVSSSCQRHTPACSDPSRRSLES